MKKILLLLVALVACLTAWAGVYDFNSTTGELRLLSGEFNKNNKWGSDVTASAVTSVTAAAGVSFTGDCSSLFNSFTNCVSMDLNNVNTASATSFLQMFYKCSKLTSLNISSWNTASVTTIRLMFYQCSSLTSLDLSDWNTASVTEMSSVFHGCSGLTSLDVSNWNTANVTNMSSMFNGCSSLTSLDLSGFNTAKVEYMSYMFKECSNLATIYAGTGWSTEKVTSHADMFLGCTALVGGMGTAWSQSHINKTYARIDKGASEPGYLTGVFTLALPEGVTAMPAPASTHDDMNLYAAGTSVTLSYSGAMPEGTRPVYSVNGTAIAGNIFEMPLEDATVTITGYQACYTYDSATGALTLLLGEFNSANKWGSDVVASAVTSVTATSAVSFTGDCSSLFDGFTNCVSMDLSNVNTATMMSTNRMFAGCSALTAIYAGTRWSTANVTSSEGMFAGCTALVGGLGTTFDANNTDKTYARLDRGASEPGYLTGVFALTLPESVTATPAATLMHGDVSLYAAGTTVTLSYSGTVPVNYWLFYLINGTAIAGDIFEMPFEDVTIDIGRRYSFNEETGVLSLIRGEFNTNHKWGDDVVASAVTSVTATSAVSFTGDCSELFSGFTNCLSMDLHNVNTDSVTNMSGMFWNCSNLTSLDLSSFNTAQVTYMDFMFCDCKKLTSLDLSGWNTARVTNMSGMFWNCSNLTSLDLSGWNTAEVENMSGMFYGCSGLTSLDLSDWNPAQVTDMSHMFDSCRGLISLDLSNWNTAQVTDMSHMFERCSGLTSLDLSGWNTAEVENMSSMFYECSSLTSLDLSSFNTAQVTDMSYMFLGCSGLISLDLSNWNTAQVTDMCRMFETCSSLTTIYAGTKWNTENVTSSDDMFYRCTALVGGMGTGFSWDHTDKEYARIDGGTSNPGYFTQGYERGDINHDGKVDVSDVNIIINIMLGKVQASSYPGNPDLNNDNKVDVSDVNAVINIMLGKE